MIEQDSTTAAEFEYLKLAVDTVRLNAIQEKVSSVVNAQKTLEKNKSQSNQGIVRNMYITGLRIAAIVVFLLGSTIMYKFITVTSQSVFNKQFIPYELTNTRGAGSEDAEAVAYYNKNWKEVVRIYRAGNGSTNKARFLAAMAELQLNHFPESETLFTSILNPSSGDKSFQEEAEYYLSLTYLMDDKENKAVGLLNRIKADKNHTYYPLASRISNIDLKIIELKKE